MGRCQTALVNLDPEVVANVLANVSVLRSIERESLLLLAAHLEPLSVKPGAVVVREGDKADALFFVIDGEAEVVRGGLHVQTIRAGGEFGSFGMVTGRVRAATVTAKTQLVLAKLSPAAWSALREISPATALQLVEALFAQAREELTHVTDVVGSLMKERSLPRSGEVRVKLLGGQQLVRTGTRVDALLPKELDGHLVVAALMNHKPVSLKTPVVSDTTLAPLTVNHWEGRQIYARSVGLLLLEAAHGAGLDLSLGPSVGTHQLLELATTGRSLEAIAGELQERMVSLAGRSLTLRHEYWAVDEARQHFTNRGWLAPAQLLTTHRAATVSLVSYADVYALSPGPMLPRTSDLSGFQVAVSHGHLTLDLGARDPRRSTFTAPAPEGSMVEEHRRWTRSMGVTSVGAFNDLCITGRVSQLIRVAEGFHEKQISLVADAIAKARDRLRIIAIAGPSSSGKTTFIKRLSVQLQINGVTPISLSLDDYYVDREKTPRDEHGEWDFEALEALDLPRLQDDLRRLLAGERVTLSRFDFKAGASIPGGGHTLEMKPGDVLLIEGIHGLNPALLGDVPKQGQLFRVFVHPATALPFDALSRMSPTDVRLLRRIVRDRHTRGYSAAENIARWPSVQAGERKHIFPFQQQADAVFDSALVYEPAVLKVFAERYLLEVPPTHPAYATAWRLRHLIDRFVAIYPDHVPPTSILREFIGGSGFEY